MGLFRRKQETLNEQLLREAGLDPAQTLGDPSPAREPRGESEPVLSEPPPRPPDDVHLSWPRGGTGDWDTVVTATVAGLAGDQVEFTTLPDGDVIVEREKGDGDLSPLADAVEQKIDPPYRAVAARQDDDLWGVAAKRIQVEKFQLAEGDAVELTQNDGVRELRVDGEPSDAEIPELARLGEQVGVDYCVEARRIDGDFWEVEVSAL
ncbi:MAG: hypothetical protein ACXVQZ_04510 [Gaiellaceae bacterium]